MKTSKFSILIASMLISQNLFSFGVNDITNAGKNYVSGKVGNLGNFNLNSLSSLGLDGLNLDDINSLNLGTFMSAFSIQCDMPSIPRVPNNLCDTLNTPDFSFNKSFDIGVCTITANSNGTPDAFNSAKEMLADLCNRSASVANSVSQTINGSLNLNENFDMKTNVGTDNITVDSEFLDSPVSIKTVNKTMPNGLKETDIYNPKTGILGFDKIYNGGKKIPEKLRNSFFNDDYATYRLYDRYAKTANSNTLANEESLNNFTPKIENTYLEYKANVVSNAKAIVGSYTTPYIVEKQIKRDLDRIKANLGDDISGSSSMEMKAKYLALKDKIMTELFKSKIETEWTTTSAGKQIQVEKADQPKLASALDSLENYELAKFGEEEANYKITHNAVVRPSQYKVETKRKEQRLAYINKIFYQQQGEIRRRAEKTIEIKQKQEMLKLLAKKVFISNMEYKSAIAEKEIEEILQ